MHLHQKVGGSIHILAAMMALAGDTKEAYLPASHAHHPELAHSRRRETADLLLIPEGDVPNPNRSGTLIARLENSMPRGVRRPAPKPVDVEALESQLAALREQQAALRQQLREARKGGSELGKLQEKLEKQFAEAKWAVQQIHALQPGWDDVGFYRSVQAKQPTPRGRRPRADTEDAQE